MTCRPRMARALAVTQPELLHNNMPTHDIVSFPAKEDTERRTFDLGDLTLPGDIKEIIRYAVEHHPISIARPTQEQYWYAITTFARFADENNLQNAKKLNTECVRMYRQWLDTQTNTRTGKPWGESHRGKKLVALRELVSTVKTGKPDLLQSEIVFPAYCYPEGTPRVVRPRRHMIRNELRSLMWVCQQEILENKRRFDQGRRILTGEEKEAFRGMRNALLTVERLTQSGIATKQRLMSEGVTANMFKKLGRAESVRSYVVPTPRSLAPLLISLMVQLAGNVDPMRKLRVDCMRTDTMDARWAMIEWEKPRAGPAPEDIQTRFADRTQRYGAPALISMVIEMTEPVRHLPNPDERDRLFICEKGRGDDARYGLLTYPMLKRAAVQFLDDARRRINEWNDRHPRKPKVQIPPFDLCEIRGSVAVEHYLASGGDIRRPHRVLNHRQLATTVGYIEGPITNNSNVQILREVQRHITRRAIRGDDEPQSTPRKGQRHRGETQPATASFTHECRSPVHESGRLCSHFQQCLDCPGLVIPKTAEHLARLLKAEEVFRSAKDRLHPDRWKWFYAKSYATLTQRILPEFPATMMPNARRLMTALPPLPDLE